jgi:antitoxin HicB
MSDNIHIGSDFDEFLEEEDLLEEVNAIAFKQVLAWQVKEEMKLKGINKTTMAQKMNTSRAALDRFLDPSNTSITLGTMERAAKAIGKRLHVELVDLA